MNISLKLVAAAALLASNSSYADWYFRGTSNNWSTTTLNAVNTNQLMTCQTFGAASTNPRFKIDRTGNWSESYPGSDYVVSANQSYKIFCA